MSWFVLRLGLHVVLTPWTGSSDHFGRGAKGARDLSQLHVEFPQQRPRLRSPLWLGQKMTEIGRLTEVLSEGLDMELQ